jgi:hypothetical protein
MMEHMDEGGLKEEVMKMSRSLSMAIVLCAIIAVVLRADDTGSGKELQLALNLAKLVRITDQPKRMRPNVSALCLPAVQRPDHGTLVKQQDAVIHVYVSPEGVAAMNKRDASRFPVGTLILKQKLAGKSFESVVLYTGMLKREMGYNADCGDWEFFTMSADGRSVTSRGRLESCMACHKGYASSDFVTKSYPIER